MDEFDAYELCVSIWKDNGSPEWNYSVVQSFDFLDSDEDIEPLFYGTENTQREAAKRVSEFISELTFE